MIHRIPSGTRDVLPDEMRELRAMTERLQTVFEQAGYGEVYTPALEYETTFERAEAYATAAGVPDVRRGRQRARAAPRHDRADRSARRDPLHARRAAAAVLLLRARLPGRASPARAVPRVAPGGDRADRRSGLGGDRRGAHRAVHGARRGGAEDLSGRARRRVAVPGAARGGRGRGRAARADPRGARQRRLRRGRARAGRTRVERRRPDAAAPRPADARRPRAARRV